MAVKPAYEKKEEGKKQVADVPEPAKEAKLQEKPAEMQVQEKKAEQPAEKKAAETKEKPAEMQVQEKKAEQPAEKKAEKKEAQKKKPDVFFATGKRRKAVARAAIKRGKGSVRINGKPLDTMSSDMLRLRIQEPLIIAGDAAGIYDIKVNVRGGGSTGQAEAARQAIAKGLVEMIGGNLKERYMSYDRNLLVIDPRRTEPHKPPRSSQGPRRYKQRSKR